jgi:hypothetical protein
MSADAGQGIGLAFGWNRDDDYIGAANGILIQATLDLSGSSAFANSRGRSLRSCQIARSDAYAGARSRKS